MAEIQRYYVHPDNLKGCESDDGNILMYEDHEREVAQKEAEMRFTYGTKPLCQLRIEIPGTKGIASTYCMRPAGHKGPCATKKQPEDFKGALDAGSSNK